ncbi:MAG: DMT family transporter [Pseudomonadota bacterium]|nr:DMT family transporter [Pseudomonadota bacterium]
MKNNPVDYLLLLTLALIWSSSFVLIKIGVGSIGPLSLTAGRLTIAAVLLALWLYLRGERLPADRRSLGMFLFIGFFGNALPFTLIGWGELHVDSSLAAILMGIMPISTALLAHLFIPDEPFTPRVLAGMACGFGGLLVLVGVSVLEGLSGAVLAQLAILGGAISYSVTTVTVRLRAHLSGTKMATGAMLAGALLSVPAALLLEAPFSTTATSESLVSMLLLGLFPTALASVIYFRVVRNLGATTFSQLNYLIPVFGSLLGILLLGEQLEWKMIAALGLVLTGIALISRR